MIPRCPRPSAVGVEPTLGTLDQLEQHLGVVLGLDESEISVSDAEGIVARVRWSSRGRRFEAVFPYRAAETDKARKIYEVLRELAMEPRQQHGKPSFLKSLACELEPDTVGAAVVVRHVLVRALAVDPDEPVAYMALDCETGEWLRLPPG